MKGVLLVGSLAAMTVVVLTAALARSVDPHRYCETGFSKLISCTYHWSSKSIRQGNPIFTTPSGSPRTFQPSYTDVTSWAVAQCPQNYIARRLLCAVASDAAPAQAASDDLATGLPRPKPWLLTTAKNSPFIEAVHVETPLDLAATLRFYRVELSKRGCTENDGAVVAPDGAVIAFTTADGQALLRLTHQGDRTIADLSLRKPAATNAGILPMPGQVRLLLGNATDEEAVITINEQTIKFAARAGRQLTDDPETGRKSPDSPEINLPPGKYKVTLKVASGASQNREFEVVADETWGLLVGWRPAPRAPLLTRGGLFAPSAQDASTTQSMPSFDEQLDRLGSIVSVWRCPSHLRYTPHSRRSLRGSAGPKGANIRRDRRTTSATRRRLPRRCSGPR